MTFEEVWNELKSNDKDGTFAKAEELSLITVESLEYAYNSGYEQGKNDRPQGEWIFDREFTEFGNPYGTYRCNKCGGHSSNKYSFCKDCGAKMVRIEYFENGGIQEGKAVRNEHN